MSFLEIFAYNIYASFFGVVTASCVGVAVLKSMHPGRRICRPGKIFFTAVYIVVLAFAATLSYKMGLLKMTASEVLLSYVTLMGNAVCISRFFEERFQICWGIVLFDGITKEFATAVSFILISDGALNLRVQEERMLYFFGNTVAVPVFIFLFLFLFYKMGLGEVYCQWMEHRDSWSRGLICLSAYPVLLNVGGSFLMGRGINRNNSLIITFIAIFLLLLLFNYMGREVQQGKEFAAQQLILKQQNVYIDTLEEMQEEMRRFRHDYKNMMSGMYLKAKEGELLEIQEFIQEMTEDFDSQIGGRIRQMSQLTNVYMTEIKGLLLVKLSEMKKEGTACELEVMNPFYGTQFRTTDLCRCLGILIDNAMDEVRGRADARVHIMISCQEGVTTFRVKNKLYHKVDIHKIWQQGYSTKGAERGIGLASYKKILNNYHNVLPVTAVEEGDFIQELKIQERSGR